MHKNEQKSEVVFFAQSTEKSSLLMGQPVMCFLRMDAEDLVAVLN